MLSPRKEGGLRALPQYPLSLLYTILIFFLKFHKKVLSNYF